MSLETRYKRDPEATDSPFAPIVEVTLRHRNKPFKGTAILDTGAPFSTISEAARQALSPKKSGERFALGATDKFGRNYPMYRIEELYLAEHPFFQIELTHLETSSPVIIIGRDILNQLEILLEGPTEKLTIF